VRSEPIGIGEEGKGGGQEKGGQKHGGIKRHGSMKGQQSVGTKNGKGTGNAAFSRQRRTALKKKVDAPAKTLKSRVEL